MNSALKTILLLLIALFLFLLPLGSPGLFSGYYIDLLTKILIFGIVLLGYDVLAGYTGLVSLGHAMFFGLGGYCAAFVIRNISSNIFLSMIVALSCAFIVGLIIAYFSTQTKDIFFVFLTLAFAQFFYLAAFNMTTVTGGDNGLSVPKATLGIPGVWEVIIQKPTGFYYLVLILLLFSYFLCRRVISSPFGRTLVGIRENEERIAFLGYNVRVLKIKAFMISALLAVMGGVLFAGYQEFVSPEMLNWMISGDLILMSVLGGMGTLIGPVLGGAIIIWMGDILSSLTENWMIFIGGFFVLAIIFAPRGVIGTVAQWYGRKRPTPMPGEVKVVE
jgi:branched-chain amino acid transport system permease protein